MKAALLLAFALLAAPAVARAQPDAGRDLYDMQCASCHGFALQGGPQAPPLLRADAAIVDFMLRTGRMPAQAPYEQEFRKHPQLSAPQIVSIEQYVMTRSQGSKDLPAVSLRSGNSALRRGRQVFAENCEQCHGATGSGSGAVGYRNVAPSILDDSPVEIAEAVREGPDVMPVFGPRVIDDKSLDDAIAYVGYLRTAQYNPGGLQLANLGPAAEGFAAWVLGMSFLVLLARRIGTAE